MRIIFLLLTISIASACSPKVKQKLGLSNNGPDASRVQTSKPLEIPPGYELPQIQ